MIYLDTHVLVWLYSGFVEKFSEHARQLMDKNALMISPMAQLELTYLHETKRIQYSAEAIIHDLQSRIGLDICELGFEDIVKKAHSLSWTRDPFDRLIVAQAMVNAARLITKDQTIRKHYRFAVW
ncbi:transposase [Gammaproteobacteria bacterium SCGC AG-212-F23]|nr:transposase [Gammaproteobacteria bacterium SCGC AG-212-F23]